MSLVTCSSGLLGTFLKFRFEQEWATLKEYQGSPWFSGSAGLALHKMSTLLHSVAMLKIYVAPSTLRVLSYGSFDPDNKIQTDRTISCFYSAERSGLRQRAWVLLAVTRMVNQAGTRETVPCPLVSSLAVFAPARLVPYVGGKKRRLLY